MYALRSPKWLPAILLIVAMVVALATVSVLAQDSEPAHDAAEAVPADTPAVRIPLCQLVLRLGISRFGQLA